MRRKDREIKDKLEILETVEKCKVFRVAMVDGTQPYIVPLNFGYSLEDDNLTLYFHSAKQGRKINILKSNSNICFEMDCEHRLISDTSACKYGYAFESIIGDGKIEFVENPNEKCKALSLIMKHQTGQDFTFNEKQAESVAILKVIPTSFTCKKSK